MCQIRWVDMDAYRHVNNTLYFRYCETARTQMLGFQGSAEAAEWARRADVDAEPTDGFVLISADMEYKKPLVYRDNRAVHVQSWVTRIGNSSFDVAHRIVDPGDLGADAKHYAACFTTMVATNNAEQRSRKLRAAEVSMLEDYMQPDLTVPNPAGRRGPQ